MEAYLSSSEPPSSFYFPVVYEQVLAVQADGLTTAASRIIHACQILNPECRRARRTNDNTRALVVRRPGSRKSEMQSVLMAVARTHSDRINGKQTQKVPDLAPPLSRSSFSQLWR